MIARLPLTMALSALLGSVTSLPVGRGRMPAGSPSHYYLLYAMPATYTGAPLADLSEDASLVYQVTAVSAPTPDTPGSYGVADQAEWMGDQARSAILSRDPNSGLWLHTLTIPGAKVIGRSLETEPGATSDQSDAIMSYVQRFRFDLTPA